RAGRAAPFCGRAALTAVRRRHSCQPAALEEVRRIGQGPKGFENTGGPVTLAYVFAHRPASGLPAGAYEDALRRFHASVATGGTPLVGRLRDARPVDLPARRVFVAADDGARSATRVLLGHAHRASAARRDEPGGVEPKPPLGAAP